MVLLPAPTAGTAAAQAFTLCAALDAAMHELHGYVGAAAQVVAEHEYRDLVTEYDSVRQAPTQARDAFDDLVSRIDPDAPDTAADDQYAAVVAQLRAALDGLEQPTIALRRLANVKAETEYAAARLTERIQEGHRLFAAQQRPDAAIMTGRLNAAARALQEAGEYAAQRRWVGALDTVETASRDVAEVLVVLTQSPATDAQPTENDLRQELASLLSRVQSQGQQTAGLVSRLRERSAEVAQANWFQVAAGELRSAAAVFADVRRVVADPHAAASDLRDALRRLGDAQMRIEQAEQLARSAHGGPR